MPLTSAPRKPGRINPEVEAAKLLQQCGFTDGPVGVEQIAQRLGITVSYQPFRGSQQQDISGMLYRDGPLAVLGINAAHSRTRQRFTMAHEIGHYWLHPGQEVWIDRLVRVNFRDSSSSQGAIKEEVQANQFAAALLMPGRQVVGDTLRMLDEGPKVTVDQAIQQMAVRYEVSKQAMEFRLVNLGLLDPETR